MPIEIKELTVKVTVQDKNSSSENSGGSPLENKEELIEECVEKVMDLLHEKYQGR